MSIYLIIVAVGACSSAVAAFHSRNRQEENLQTGPLTRGQKTALIEPLTLPIALVTVSVMLLIIDIGSLSVAMFARSILLFLVITIYHALLLLLLPLLRRIISARACAVLWLLPNVLYFSVNISYYEAPPWFAITIPLRWLTAFAWVWAVGFTCVAIWQFVSHFRYRRFLLKNSEEVTDDRILSLWHNESSRHGMRARIPVFVTDAVSTPMSIGCFDRTMRLLLPHQNYSDEELLLIFRHELMHILRLDMRTKLFMGLCTAACWFNPLAWVARRKASDDLELSCDEAVLAGADEAKRRLYAELLLKNAGNGRGYTTCLSASAETLRYRLRSIVRPVKRLSGGAAVGFALFGLIMSLGKVALADSVGTVQSLIFDKAPAEIAIERISTYRQSESSNGLFVQNLIYKWEEDALTAYLASLRVKQVYTGNYEEPHNRKLYVDYAEYSSGEVISLTRFELCDGLLFANLPYDDLGEITFIFEDEVDWEYIDSLLDFRAANPNPDPFPPDMMMDFGELVDTNGELMHASKTILSIKVGGVEQEIDSHDHGAGGVYGIPVAQVKLHFSYAPSGGYEVQVESWDKTSSYAASSDDLTDDVLTLAPYSAHYTVYATFDSFRNTTYEMKFVFDVELDSDRSFE